MADFTVRDVTTHRTTHVNGTRTFEPGGSVSLLNDQTATDSLHITSNTPDVCILTGSGNDNINVSASTGRVAIDAGSGINFIAGSTSANVFTAEGAPTPTFDTIANFHAGDCLTLNGDFTLNWSTGAVGVTVQATEAGSAPVTVTLLGVHSQADLFTAIGHGGAQCNIGMLPT